MPVSERTRLATLKARERRQSSHPQTRAAVLGGGVGGLQLAEDLRFADDHGIEAGGDAEEMMDGLAAFVAVELRA